VTAAVLSTLLKMLERVPMGARSSFLTHSASERMRLRWNGPSQCQRNEQCRGVTDQAPRFLAHTGEMRPLAGREAELFNALASPRGFHEADCRHQRDVEIAK
jgi:hypothetical protein